MTTLSLGQVLEVTTERLAFGGFAVARHDGIAVFVPYGAPGERLKVEITEIDKKFIRTRLLEVLTPSKHRRKPRCRHFGDCGGCQFQHIDYPTQIAAKADFVRDALIRTGGFDWPNPIKIHYAEEWGYRARTQIKVEGEQLGFHRAFSKTIVELQECPVLAPELESALPMLRKALADRPKGERVHQLEGARGKDGASWAPELPGLRKDLVEHQVLGFRYFVEPESFFQGNHLLVEQLVRGATEGLSGQLAFDLYAGVGLFSLPLSRGFARVVSVEDERRAATLGRVNVKLNGCNNVSYFRETTEGFLADNKERPDLVLIDPPRLGAKLAIPALLKLRAANFVYVSCDPNTLARDLKDLVAGGYVLQSVEGYDMFPQTYHVECVARLCLA
ncbi:MAG: class I SAM-dependent RNA methyltransferase [Planctomycetota bacterium]